MQSTTQNPNDTAVAIKKKTIAELKSEIHRLIEEKSQGIPKGQEDIREMLAVYVKGDFISLLVRTREQPKEQGFHCGSPMITEEELLKAIEFLEGLDKEKILTWRKSQRPLAAAIALGFARSMKEKERLEHPVSQTRRRKRKKAATEKPKGEEDIGEEELELLRDSIMGRLQVLEREERQKGGCSFHEEKRSFNGSFFASSPASSATASAASRVSQHKSQEKAKFTGTPHFRAAQLIKENNVVSGENGVKIIDEEALGLLLIEQNTDSAIVHEINEIIRLIRQENMERALLKEREAQKILESAQEKKEEAQESLDTKQKQNERGSLEQREVANADKKNGNSHVHRRMGKVQHREKSASFSASQSKQSQDLLPSDSSAVVLHEKNKVASGIRPPNFSRLDEEMQLQMRLLHYFRINDTANLKEAIEKHAAKWPESSIACALGPLFIFCFPKNPPEGYRIPIEILNIILAKIDKADPEVICAFGFRFIKGVGVEVNNAEGARLLKMAAARGCAEAMHFYGYFFCYHGEQHGSKMDVNAAIKWFEKAAGKGSVIAKYYLGLSYQYLHDDKTAFKYFSEACLEGDYQGLYQLGEYYLEGGVVKKDLEKAFDCFLRGADHGEFNAQYHVAECFFKGMGTKQDLVKAKTYFLMVYRVLVQDTSVGASMLVNVKLYLSLLYLRGIPIEGQNEACLLEWVVRWLSARGEEAEEVKLYLKRLMAGEKKSLVTYCMANYLICNDNVNGHRNGFRLYAYAFLLGCDIALEKLLELKASILNVIPKNQSFSTNLTEVALLQQIHLFTQLDTLICHDAGLKVCMDVHGLIFAVCTEQCEQLTRLQKLREIFSDIFNPEYKIKNIAKCAVRGYFHSALLFLHLSLLDDNLRYEDLSKLKESIEFLGKKIEAASGENQELMENFTKLKSQFKRFESAAAAALFQAMSGGMTFSQ